MGLDLKTIPAIQGEDAIRLRLILRKAHDAFRVDWLTETFGFNKHKARGLARSLLDRGYIQRDHELENRKEIRIPWYRVTAKGKELARASAAARLSRKTACRAIDEFMQRVHCVNNNPAYLYSVRKVVVFGSFLGSGERLGDVDLAVDLKPRIALEGTWWEVFQQHAVNSGRYFQSYDHEIDWPRREVMLALKARKRSISIQSWFSFVEMEKPSDFRYKILLGNAREIRCELDPSQAKVRSVH